ncbi:hypothetical protein NHH03_14130 [Stieleria sp. TO1_6]|uniref:hypothetical protein n=1 Tax=Stieleria tagensis TaxID=2956795 RepID=UPI00209B0DDC|nr:hypothetical protein [Stieleria tagensis]MCO8122882.1 hypothetical protein [Stieleria tagensis]
MLAKIFCTQSFANPHIPVGFPFDKCQYPWLEKIDPDRQDEWFVQNLDRDLISNPLIDGKHQYNIGCPLSKAQRVLADCEEQIDDYGGLSAPMEMFLIRFTTRLIINETSNYHRDDVRHEASRTLDQLNQLAGIGSSKSNHPHDRLIPPQLD